MKNIGKKVEYAVLWAATVALGAIIINMKNDKPIDWLFALTAGLVVGVVNFVWAVIRETISQRKSRKKDSENSTGK